MADITERREVRVEQDGTTFVFLAEPDRGRLVIREETPEAAEEICAVTISDRDELSGFLEGLRRVLGVEAGQGRGAASRPAPAPPPADTGRRELAGPGDSTSAPTEEDRDEIIERARERNPNAFKKWTNAEERELLDAYDEGTSVAELAKRHERSENAIRIRLEKLGRQLDDVP